MYAEKSTVVYYMLYIRGKFALRDLLLKNFSNDLK